MPGENLIKQFLKNKKTSYQDSQKLNPNLIEKFTNKKATVAEEPTSNELFKIGIAHKESRGTGNYLAKNKRSSASGRYQILYDTYKDDLKNLYNINSREEFLKSPKEQEDFFNMLISEGTKSKGDSYREDAEKLRAEYGDMPQPHLVRYVESLRDDELMALSHFLGKGGAREYLASIRDEEEFSVPGQNNASVENFLQVYNEGIQQYKMQ